MRHIAAPCSATAAISCRPAILDRPPPASRLLGGRACGVHPGRCRPGRSPVLRDLDLSIGAAAPRRGHGAEDRTITLEPTVWRWTRAGEPAPLAEVSLSVTLGAGWGEVGAGIRYRAPDASHRSAAPAGATDRHPMPVRRRALVVAVPKNRREMRQALPPERRAVVLEPGRISPRLRLAARDVAPPCPCPRPPATSQAGRQLRGIVPAVPHKPKGCAGGRTSG